MLKIYELKENQIKKLYDFSRKIKIDFLLSVFDESSYFVDKKLRNEIKNSDLLKEFRKLDIPNTVWIHPK